MRQMAEFNTGAGLQSCDTQAILGAGDTAVLAGKEPGRVLPAWTRLEAHSRLCCYRTWEGHGH